MARPPLLRMEGVTKRFGDLLAKDRVSLDVRQGEVMALLGENGAGKSTQMKTLLGLHAADEGSISIDGRSVDIATPKQAMALGIGMVFQQFSLLPAMSVLENLLLAWPKAGAWRSRREDEAVLRHLRSLAPDLDPSTPVRKLPIGTRQLVELAKVLNLDARLVILDEPTSVLTPAEANRLHDRVRSLADEGRSVTLITHKLADVRACADRVTVMRQGRVVDSAALADRDDEALVQAMIGARVTPEPRDRQPIKGLVRLVLQNLSVGGQHPVHDIDLTLYCGEIVGLAGVAGNGQWALAEAVAGLVAPKQGDILLDGLSVARRYERQTFSSPIAYIPEDPIHQAVIGNLDLETNLRLRTLGKGPRQPADDAKEQLSAFDVRPPSPKQAAKTLSGGNLQKLVAARELGGTTEAIVACYPTMGLDIRAREAIFSALIDHARQGAAVLWISEELDDLLRFADRIAVLRAGRIVGLVDASRTDATTLGHLMTGTTGSAGTASSVGKRAMA